MSWVSKCGFHACRCLLRQDRVVEYALGFWGMLLPASRHWIAGLGLEESPLTLLAVQLKDNRGKNRSTVQAGAGKDVRARRIALQG